MSALESALAGFAATSVVSAIRRLPDPALSGVRTPGGAH
jgi:hypothetical protein